MLLLCHRHDRLSSSRPGTAKGPDITFHYLKDKRMKKLLLSLMALASATAIHAYDYPTLTFRTSDGTEQAVSVESLTLTVTGESLVASNTEGKVTLTLTDLDKMYFTTTPSGIDDIGTDAAATAVDVYTLTGTKAGSYPRLGQAKGSLEPGIYVIRTHNGTQKVAIQ